MKGTKIKTSTCLSRISFPWSTGGAVCQGNGIYLHAEAEDLNAWTRLPSQWYRSHDMHRELKEGRHSHRNNVFLILSCHSIKITSNAMC